MLCKHDFPTRARYDSNLEEHVNSVCGMISDVGGSLLVDLDSRVAKKAKYCILGCRFELYGYTASVRVRQSNL